MYFIEPPCKRMAGKSETNNQRNNKIITLRLEWSNSKHPSSESWES